MRDKFSVIHRKIPKISPAAYIFQRPFFEGHIFGGAYLWREIDWASPIVGRKFTVFALFYFVFECKFQRSTSPRGGISLEGRFNGGFFALRVWGLLFEGAYTPRGLFSEFYGTSVSKV